METCKICGKEIHYRYSSKIEAELKAKGVCDTCDFWLEKQAFHTPENEHKWCVADGIHYIVGNENSKDYFRGFGGSHVRIHFNDGTVVDSTNLWCQGDIPEGYWRDHMPDNATLEWCR